MTYLFVVLIIIIPFIVYPEPLLGPIKNEYILKNYLLIFLFLSILIKSIGSLFKQKYMKIKNTDKLVFLFLCFCSLSWIVNKIYFFPEQLLFTIIFVSLFLFISHAAPETYKRNSIIIYWKISLLLICCYGLYQFISHFPVTSTLGNRNFFACFIVSGFPFIIMSLAKNFKRKPILAVTDLLLIALMLFNLYYTKSRAAWIILLFQFVFFITFFIRRKILFLSVLVLIVCSIFLFPKSRGFLKKQIDGDVRPFIWQSTLQMISEHPILGVGAGNFYIAYPFYRIHEYFLLSKSTDTTKHAHNEFLEIWAETGSLGFFSLMGMFAILIINIVNYKKQNKIPPFICAVIISALSIALHNLVDVNMRYIAMSVIFWMNLGILASFFDKKSVQVRLFGWINHLKIPVIVFIGILGIYLVWNFVVLSYGAETNFQKAINAKDKKDYGKAVYYYDKSLKYNKNNLSLLYHYAYVLDLKDLRAECIEIYKKIIKIAPYYAAVRKNLATCYLKKGDFVNAVKEYDVQLLLNPYDPDVYLNIAYCYRKLNMNDEAVLSHNKAIKTYLTVSKRLINDGSYPKAVSYLSTAIQIDSANKDIVFLLITAYVKSRQKQQAVELANVFLSRYPQDKKYVEHLYNIFN